MGPGSTISYSQRRRFIYNQKHNRGASCLAIFGVMTFCDDLLRACTTDDNDLTLEFSFLFGMSDILCCLCTFFIHHAHDITPYSG